MANWRLPESVVPLPDIPASKLPRPVGVFAAILSARSHEALLSARGNVLKLRTLFESSSDKVGYVKLDNPAAWTNSTVPRPTRSTNDHSSCCREGDSPPSSNPQLLAHDDDKVDDDKVDEAKGHAFATCFAASILAKGVSSAASQPTSHSSGQSSRVSFASLDEEDGKAPNAVQLNIGVPKHSGARRGQKVTPTFEGNFGERKPVKPWTREIKVTMLMMASLTAGSMVGAGALALPAACYPGGAFPACRPPPQLSTACRATP